MNLNLFFKIGVCFTLALFLNNSIMYAQSCEELRRENEKLKSENEDLKEKVEYLQSNKGGTSEPKNNPKKGRESEVVNKDVVGGGKAVVSVKSFAPKYKVEFLSCTGNKNSQTVTIEFSLFHQLANQNFYFYVPGYVAEVFAYDFKGQKYDAKEWGGIGAENSGELKIPYDIPVKGYVIFRNVLPNVDKLKIASIHCYSANEDGGQSSVTGKLEFRNITIDWK